MKPKSILLQARLRDQPTLFLHGLLDLFTAVEPELARQPPLGHLSAHELRQGLQRYVVLPPSAHPNGQAYEWATEGVAPALVPTWLLARWPKAGTWPPFTSGTPPGAPIIDGQRNSALAALDRLLAEAGQHT